RDEVRAPALHQVRTKTRMALRRRAVGAPPLTDPAAEHRRVVRLCGHYARRRACGLQRARDTLQRAAGAETGDPVIEAVAGEVGDDFLCGRALMHLGVRFVLELPA